MQNVIIIINTIYDMSSNMVHNNNHLNPKQTLERYFNLLFFVRKLHKQTFRLPTLSKSMTYDKWHWNHTDKRTQTHTHTKVYQNPLIDFTFLEKLYLYTAHIPTFFYCFKTTGHIPCHIHCQKWFVFRKFNKYHKVKTGSCWSNT